MSALNSLPLPVVRLLAFFHEELSERRPGRVPQTVQLWVGCLLVILISMTFEIPFVALSLAVLFYGIQSNAFYTKFVAILFVVATVLEIGSLFLIYKWSYGEPLIRLIIAGPILMGCMFLMRTHRLGLVFFAVAIVAIYGQTFPAMLDYPEVVVRLTLWCIVVGLYPTLLMTLIGVLWFPSRAISQMHQALNDRLDDAISHLTDSLAPLPETRIEREALALQKLNVFCLADDANWRTQNAWWQSCVATVTYNGLEAQVPFHGARAQILAVDKQIVAVKGQITETRESLRALIGAGASDMPEIRPVALPQVQTGIPATLSYELLARRPDLQAMRWYVQASLDQVDSARALFYPSFDIKAFFGLDSIHLHTLFKKTSRQFNFIPGLKLPLFDGGRLNANLEGTRAASNMMIERYNQSVLNAVRDVAVNGTRLQTLNDEREMQAERVEATRFTQRAAEAAYQRGLTSRLQATEARLPVLAEEMSLLMLDSRRVIQSIQLMKSLGGGYQAGPVVEKK